MDTLANLLNKALENINKLNEAYDTVGCNYHDVSGQNNKHYSGNFWWGKTNFLKKLTETIKQKYKKSLSLNKNNSNE